MRVAVRIVVAMVASMGIAVSLGHGPESLAVSGTMGVPLASVKVIREIPKEAAGFTQGIEVRNGVLYESVGLYGQSEIRTVSLKTGRVTKRAKLETKFFAEGMTLIPEGIGKAGKGSGGGVVQLTWQEKTAILRNAKTLEKIATYNYEEEGWGICFSQTRKLLVHSDGSNTLYLRDPKTFDRRSSLSVEMPDGSKPRELNELECEKNSVFANVWQQNHILEIDQTSGKVLRKIDASSIVPPNLSSPDDVLNGIAALGKGRYLLTGKRWPSYFEVTFVPASS
jgi:glutaminyl-peptide cyclotransferase